MGMKTSRVNLFLATAAVLLFVPLFILRGDGPLDFWWWMSWRPGSADRNGSGARPGLPPASPGRFPERFRPQDLPRGDLGDFPVRRLFRRERSLPGAVFIRRNRDFLRLRIQGRGLDPSDRPSSGVCHRAGGGAVLARIPSAEMGGPARPWGRVCGRDRALYGRPPRLGQPDARSGGRRLRRLLGPFVPPDRLGPPLRRKPYPLGPRGFPLFPVHLKSKSRARQAVRSGRYSTPDLHRWDYLSSGVE